MTEDLTPLYLARLGECQFIFSDFKPYVDNDPDNNPNEIKDDKRCQIGFDCNLISMKLVQDEEQCCWDYDHRRTFSKALASIDEKKRKDGECE